MNPRTHRGLIVAFLAYVAVLLSLPSPARAEDIDIFRVNPNLASQRPNVLIILDSSSNWASTDTVAGGTKYEHVRKALADAIEGYTDGSGVFHPGIMQGGQFNVGLMMYAETGGGNSNVDGGVLRIGMRHLDPNTNGPALARFFRTVDANYDKANNTTIGLAFYEAFQYFTGGAPYAGNNKAKSDYTGNTACASGCVLGTTGNQANDNPTLAYSDVVWNLPVVAPLPRNALDSIGATRYNKPTTDVCQKNFIIYISNGNVTDSASVNATARDFLTTVGGDTSTIDITSIDDDNEGNYSDEWTRFLSTRPDVTDRTVVGSQTIVSYTVEVNKVDDNQGRANHELLQSMADNGKGRHFDVSSADGGVGIAEALNQIFAEILAVNSVFASVTLPASVNVRGTFLNQVYMGVFRPDANSSPRWAGNLKQYQLKLEGTAPNETVVLADRNNVAVEDKSATGLEQGLVRADAVSFWTTPSTFWNTTFYPDTKAKAPLTPTTSDVPDGQFVEKGGHAEQLRKTFATSLAARKLYTCIGCAAGTDLSVSPDPAAPAYEFHPSNTLITDTMLGITASKSVDSLTRVGSTVTAVATNHGFANNQNVTIGGAVETDYNVSNQVTVLDANRFTYQITERPVSPATPAAGPMVADRPGTSRTINSITRSGTIARVTTQGAHGFSTGNSVLITGTTDAAYQGTFPITVVDGFIFEYTVPTTPATPPISLAGAQVKIGGTTKNISTLTRSGQTVTVTTSGNIFTGASPATGTITEIKNVNPTTYNCADPGCAFTYVKLSNSSFTYQLLSAIGPADEGPVGATAAVSAASSSIASITRTPGAAVTMLSTVTVTTSAAHAFSSGQTINISGAAQTEYNGPFTIANATPGTTTFTYQLVTQPASPATVPPFTATGSGGINKTSLINWVRGANTQADDNPDLLLTSVRAYLHGDVLHSRPVVVNYNRSDPPDDRDIVVYYGANDGMIHAVKGGQTDADGVEKWSFIPTEFYNRFPRLYLESPITTAAAPRTYFADGPVSANLEFVPDPASPDPANPIERLSGVGAKAQIYAGMRRGGRFYYSLDVIDPDRPVYKWKIDNSTPGFSELGQTWSEPKVAKITLANCPATGAAGICKVLIFGAGYDAAANDPATQVTATMGRGIFVVDATTGTLIWQTTPRTLLDVNPPTGSYVQTLGMTYAIPADLAVIDSDRDVPNNLADRIYAADTGGNIWRVNISDPDPSNWTVGKVASLGGSGANARKFLFAPDIVQLDASTDSILVGSGDREQPFDLAIANRFYMVKDSHAINALPDPAAPVTETDLCPLSIASPDASACIADTTKKGWRFELRTGEKVVTGATTLAGTTIFGTNTPASQSAPGQCTGSLGQALIYAVNFKNATPGLNWDNGGAFGGFAGEDTRGGFPSSAAPYSVKLGDKYYEGAIVTPKVIEPVGPELLQRYRVFWNLSVDN